MAVERVERREVGRQVGGVGQDHLEEVLGPLQVMEAVRA